jgi:hypothetical protein
VDLYDQEAAGPVLDSAGFYADCRKVLTDDGCMTVNLFGRSSSFQRSVDNMAHAFGADALWAFKATREGNTVVLAQRTPVRPTRSLLMERADFIQRQWGLPADKWVRVFQTGESMTAHISTCTASANRTAFQKGAFRSPGLAPLVEWLHADGVISDDQATRTIARCAQAESVQHPLVRLASVSMRRRWTTSRWTSKC